jgi:hypothetical protein
MASLWHRTSSFVESNLARKEHTPVLSSRETLMGCVKSLRTSTRKKQSNGSLRCSTWSETTGSKIHSAHSPWGICLLRYELPFLFRNYSIHLFWRAHYVFEDSWAGPSCVLLVSSIEGLAGGSGCSAEQSLVPS